MKLFRKLIDSVREGLDLPVSLGLGRLQGWKDDLEFFRFKCQTHGSVVSYRAGHSDVLLCPLCLGIEVIYPRVIWLKGR